MPLNAMHMQVGGHGTATAIFHNIADARGAGRLADQTVIKALIACHQRVDHFDGAVDGAGFFIRSDEKSQTTLMMGIGGDKPLCCYYHRRQ